MKALGDIVERSTTSESLRFRDDGDEPAFVDIDDCGKYISIGLLGFKDYSVHFSRDQVAALVAHLQSWLATGSFEVKEVAEAPARPLARVLRETQQTITQWCEETFGPAESNALLVDRAIEEMEEASLCVKENDNDPKLAVEIADIFIVLYRVATRLGVDLHEVIDQKMAVNRGRRWMKDGKGCGYHVKGQ